METHLCDLHLDAPCANDFALNFFFTFSTSKKYYFILWALREITRNNLHSKQTHIMQTHFMLSYKINWVIENIIVIIDLLFKVWTHFIWNC